MSLNPPPDENAASPPSEPLLPRAAINLPPDASTAMQAQPAFAPPQYAAPQPPQPPTPLFPDGTQGAQFKPNTAIKRKNGRNLFFTLLYIFGPLIALIIYINTVFAAQMSKLVGG
ncbi:MAG: hypothetical protein ABI400_06105 [Lacisediminihabitans sp.]